MKEDQYYKLVPSQEVAAVGHCGKCGAPYFMESPWWGVTPPTPIPTCACWNIPISITTTEFRFVQDTSTTAGNNLKVGK